MGLGKGPVKGPINDDEGFFVPADFKCFRKGVWGWGGDSLINMKDSLFLLISNVSEGGVGPEGGPPMMVKDSLFLLISHVLGRGVGMGRGPSNDEGICFC